MLPAAIALHAGDKPEPHDWYNTFHLCAQIHLATLRTKCISFVTQGTFYNDMRDESAVDMSYSIRDFCQQQSVKVPPPAPSVPPAYPPACSRPAQDDKSPQSQPRAHKMEETTFDNLFLRVIFTLSLQVTSPIVLQPYAAAYSLTMPLSTSCESSLSTVTMACDKLPCWLIDLTQCSACCSHGISTHSVTVIVLGHELVCSSA